MTDPARYAVIGNPIAHSKSPDIHARFAAQTGQALTYEKLLAPLDGFATSARDFAAHDGQGMNVTVPFKLDAFALATQLTPRARMAGAVNTWRRSCLPYLSASQPPSHVPNIAAIPAVRPSQSPVSPAERPWVR